MTDEQVERLAIFFAYVEGCSIWSDLMPMVRANYRRRAARTLAAKIPV